MHRYPQLFNGIDMDQLQVLFLNYQLLIDEEIPKECKGKGQFAVTRSFRVYHLWGYRKR